MNTPVTFEGLALWGGLLCYVAGGTLSIIDCVFDRRWHHRVAVVLLMGSVLHALAIGLRWERVGHGPFITMFEILSSNIWSLAAIFLVFYRRIPAVRPSSVVVMPILFMMMGWLLVTNPVEGHFPPTYRTAWLFVHVAFGKLFLGSILVAVGLSGAVLLRRAGVGWKPLQALPGQAQISALAFRFVVVGFIFESLMLVAGAIWAQDAWGRYWAWDPLETWAFLTWLMVALFLHARVSMRLSETYAAVTVLAIFVAAFLTFFGVPFVSLSPHKGAI